jgi:hypothetical protein
LGLLPDLLWHEGSVHHLPLVLLNLRRVLLELRFVLLNLF